MGTKVEVKNNNNNNNCNSNSYFPGYYSMRDLNNEDSSSNSWPQFYSDNTSNNNSINANGTILNNGFFPPGYDKDSVKQTMLQHEAIFKHQVIELHRVYRIQRDMMEDFRRRELQKHVIPIEMSSSSSPVAPRLLDANKWRKSSFSGRGQSVSGAEVITSKQTGLFPCGGDNSEDCEILDSRPSKVMKRLFDLQLPPDQQYIDSEGENSPIRERDGLKQGCFRGIADLNEPAVQVDEGIVTGALNLNDRSGKAVVDLTAKSKSPFFVGFQNENRYGNSNSFFENKGKGNDWLPHINEAVTGNNKTNMNLIPESSSVKPVSINGFETSRERKQDLFIDRRVPWLSGNPIRNFEPSQATSSSVNRNGYYHGSPSVPKETTPPGFPSVGRTINCRSNHFDLPDLNKISYDGFFNHEDDGKKQPDEEQHVGVAAAELPWLKTKVADEEQHVGNIPGFPIPSSKSKDEPLPSQGNNNGSKARMIDINVAYDSDSDKTTPPKEVGANNSIFLIDLNSCVSDDELPSPPLITSRNSLWRGCVQIDLEAPPAEEPDFDDDIIEEEEEDNTRAAAEAIVAISTTAPISQDNEKTSWLPLGEDSMEDPLSWFADILISSPHPPAKVSRRSSSSSLDEFEMMTLNLPEMKEEEYMPKPLVQILNREEDEMDEAGTGTVSSMANRTRRGPGRRGRQRRDFQRDILPGLASLSRHEVTEDIQTFGGLMRATGHQWQSGVTRRNGSRNGSGRGRGRRPNSTSVAAVQVTTTTTTTTGPSSTDCTQLIQQMSCADDVWGKTPRRPRRQRSCPQGNNPPQTTVLLA
ncbi:uncharacterized protein LOC124925686 [Impatiens glandulifera]|uniref:uncharacterized protein LOC124925686 n=1 Tax=Impatiens glandulifera TaxID=253017 RepID=UPI001FB0C545|nr:uncharacterized protein LOC124925686 [Impatiens glandulifera]